MNAFGFKNSAEMHDVLIKEAFIGAVAGGLGRAALGAGKFVVKNPLKSLTIGMTAMDVGGAAGRGSRQAASSAAQSAMQNFSHVGPTF